MPKDFVGIQIGAISFIDEGVETVLKILQDKGAVNALVIGALSWSRGNAGRAILGTPDHGSGEPDNLVGGAFWEPSPKYYGNSPLKEFRAPDPLYEGFDTFRDVIPAAKKRELKVYAYYCETPRVTIKHNSVPNAAQIGEVDLFGRKANRPCNNNPGYRAWVFSFIEDWCNQNIDGVLWGIERQSGLKALLSGETPTCFCRFCLLEGKRQNIDAGRAQNGYKAVYEYLKRVKAGENPPDGFFVTFLRILLNHPEIFQWEKMWLESHRGLHRELAGVVKFVDSEKEVGFGIWQEINTFSPYLRAQFDYEEFIDYADWLKPIVYHVPAGARFARYVQTFQPLLYHKEGEQRAEFIQEAQATVLRDFGPDLALDLFYALLNLEEAPLPELAERGFSPEYVRRETARTVAGVGGKVKVYPGIGIGVPGGPGSKEIEPDDVRQAIQAAYEGGADGVLLSRNYSETMLKNLEAAGDVLRDLGNA
jgi:hypothetical protein